MRRGEAALTGVLVALAATTGRSAHGDDGKNRDAVSAEALFAEGRRLMASGNYAEACPKFADSETLDPAPGTALNLAACYEKLGKLATAWAAFQSAESLARRAGQYDRASAARERASALEPTLSRLTVSVPDGSLVAGLEVRCDDHPVLMSEWGLPLPRDGGAHQVAASAPGRKTWQTRAELQPSGQQLVVTVPRLEDALPAAAEPPAPPSLPPPVAPSSRVPSGAETAAAPTASAPAASVAVPARGSPQHTHRTIGLAAGGAGIATILAGAVTWVVAKSQYNGATNEHGPSRVDDSARAVHLANAGGLLVTIGAAMTVSGGVLWWTSPSSPARVGTDGRELLLRGSF